VRVGRTIARLACFCCVLAASSLAAGAAPLPFPPGAGAPWSDAQIATLGSDLDALLSRAPALAGAHVGVYVVETATGTVLYARSADDEFQPASTLKLVVGSAALERLGAAFRFRTTLVATGAELVLRAGGDPLLEVPDFDAAARAAGASGIAAVAGGPRIDTRHFDAQPYPAGWTWDDFVYDYAARVSAIGLQENVLHVSVTPGARVGAAPHLATSSFTAVRSAGDGCAGDEVVVRNRARTGPPGSDPDALDLERTASCIDVVGTIPQGAPATTLDAAVPDPVRFAQAALAGALATARTRPGVAQNAAGTAATERLLWQHDSVPLAQLLGPRFWIPSDNFVGEVLLKELGFAALGGPGTTAKGVAYEKLWLRSIGVDPATVTLADGCGMSQYDRITPRDLVTVLQHDWNGPNRTLVLDSLPVGGARGTIEGIAGTVAAGRVFAKTGSMMHVRGLAGYLATIHHAGVTFAFHVDDWNGAYPALAALRAAALARIVSD